MKIEYLTKNPGKNYILLKTHNELIRKAKQEVFDDIEKLIKSAWDYDYRIVQIYQVLQELKEKHLGDKK